VDVEGDIRALREAGDLRAAATRAIEAYGAEVMGFLVSYLRDVNDAADVFSQASEDLWAGLERFEGRSSVRTWFYTLARNAASRLRRSPHRRPGRNVPLSQAAEAAERVRSQTLPHLRTEVKDKFAEIRSALDPEDQALLVLRVDRAMDWTEVARVLEPDEAGSDDSVARAAARLRKRYERVKAEVRERAKAAGLLDRD